MLNKKTASAFFLESQNTRVALRQITCPEGFCLIIEDEPPIAKYLEKILSSKKMICQIVNTAEAALNVIKEKASSIICIVLDLNLEEKNAGQKVVEILEENFRSIPYVVYTGEKDKERILKKEYPHINVAVKGRNNTQVLLNALGIV